MSVPLTLAQTSGAGCRVRSQPASSENETGKRNAAARNALAVREVTIRAGFGRIEVKGIGSGGFGRASSANLGYLAGADARGADAQMLVSARNHGANALQVRVPAAAAGIVGVGDHVAIMRPFAAEITLQCHVSSC